MIWVQDIEATIFSIIKYKTEPTLKNKFPNIRYSTEQATEENVKFPHVYVHLLPMVEQGGDIEGKTVNAVMATFQIDITSNTTKSDVLSVSYKLIEALKQIGFIISMFPEASKENNVHRAVLRARRLIGNGDKI